MSMSRVISLLCVLLMVCSCAGRHQEQNRTDELRTRILNFWSDKDAGSTDAGVLEQNIVDYLYLVQHADSATREDAWCILHSELENRPDRVVVDYLGNPDSPLYSVGMLEEYLESLVSCLPSDDLSAARAGYLLENIRKNKPGDIISDLALMTEHSGGTSLHELVNDSGRECIVLFYDPDCSTCGDVIGRLSSMYDPEYGIVAISVTDRTAVLPEEWFSTRIRNTDELEDKFYLPSLPAVYAVSSAGVIREKIL